MGIGSKNRREQLNGNSLADGNSFNRPTETHRWKKTIKRQIKTILLDGNSFKRDKYSFNRQKEVDLIDRCQQFNFLRYKLKKF